MKNDIEIKFETLQQILKSASAVLLGDKLMRVDRTDQGCFELASDDDQTLFHKDNCKNIWLTKENDGDRIVFRSTHGEDFTFAILEPPGCGHKSMREQVLKLESESTFDIIDRETIIFNGETINVPEGFDFEIVGYEIEEKEDFIQTLASYISEAREPDLTLMIDDLTLIVEHDDPYFFSSTSTNEFLFPSEQYSDEAVSDTAERLVKAIKDWEPALGCNT